MKGPFCGRALSCTRLGTYSHSTETIFLKPLLIEPQLESSKNEEQRSNVVSGRNQQCQTLRNNNQQPTVVLFLSNRIELDIYGQNKGLRPLADTLCTYC